MTQLPPYISPQYGYQLQLPVKLSYDEKWCVSVLGIAGRYLYTSNTVSKSFDNDLTSLGYDWFFPSYESAIQARDIYRNQGHPQLDAFYPDHNSAVLNAVTHPPTVDAVPLESEVIFLEPRCHLYLHTKWIVTTHAHAYSMSYSLYADGSVQQSNDGLLPCRLFDTEEEALAALTAYRAKYRSIEPTPVESTPLRPISERINFLPPRAHLLRAGYVICVQDQPPFRQYLSANLEIGNHASAHTASANVYDSLEEAQQALDAYNALFEPAPLAPPIPEKFPSLEGIFKFQLPVLNHTLEQYYIPSISGNEYLWKDLTVRTITPQELGYYDTYDQALFAKLRYERMHR